MTALPKTISEKQRLDRRLDRALQDSFPASDPVAIIIDHSAIPPLSAKPMEIMS
jgi:hypothetical protein